MKKLQGNAGFKLAVWALMSICVFLSALFAGKVLSAGLYIDGGENTDWQKNDAFQVLCQKWSNSVATAVADDIAVNSGSISYVERQQLESALKAWQATLPEGTAVSMSLLSDQLADGSKTAGALHDALEAASRTLYGNYNGALNIYNLPTSLMAAITAAVIPAVSGTLARRDRKGASRVAGSALRISALLAFPMGVGLYVLGKPIMALIFPSLTAELAGPLLSTLGLATVFVCMMLVCNSILQAYGFVNLPVIIMLAGGVIKIVLNYNVVVLPQVGIYGAPLGNIFCFALCLILDLIVMARVIPGCPKYIPLFAKPAAAAAVMGLGAWAVHGLLAKLFAAGRMGNAVSTLAAILVAVVIYGVLVIVLRAITKEDLALMPKGEKIARILHLS